MHGCLIQPKRSPLTNTIDEAAYDNNIKQWYTVNDTIITIANQVYCKTSNLSIETLKKNIFFDTTKKALRITAERLSSYPGNDLSSQQKSSKYCRRWRA